MNPSRLSARARGEYLGFAAILALAAWLRVGWPGNHSFGFDEGRVSLMALEMARQGTVARLGMSSSTGIPNLPGAIWLFALPFRLTHDPLWVSLGVGLLGVLAVGGVWWLARRAWGAWAGLGAALAFAVSPYAVFYSRGIWGQDLLPPLAVLWAVASVYGVARNKWWALALHVFLAGFAFQVHYAGITLIPASLWLILRFRLWRRWPGILLGGALAALCAWPYVRTVWCGAPLVRAAWEGLLRQPAQSDLTAWRQFAEMAVGANWEWLPLGPEWRWPQGWAWAMGAANVLLGALMLGGLVASLAALWRDRRAAADERVVLMALLPAWALAGPLAFTRHSTPAYHQYQLAALPAAFLALGAGVWLATKAVNGFLARITSAAPSRKLKKARLVKNALWIELSGRFAALIRFKDPLIACLLGLLLAASLVQSVSIAQGLSVIAARLTPGGWGTPLHYPRAVARALQDGGRVVVHAHSDQTEVDGDAAAFRVLLWGYDAQVVDGRAALLIPAADAAHPPHLLMTFADLPAWGELAASGLMGTASSFPRREGEPRFVALTAQGVHADLFQSLAPLTLANGAQLVGYRARIVGGRWRISCLWRIVGPLQPGRYHQFNHLRASLAGEPLAIRDAPASSVAWQVGDTLITWADFDPPTGAGPFWLDVGMYSYPQMERSAVLGREGDPFAPIRLGPLVP